MRFISWFYPLGKKSCLEKRNNDVHDSGCCILAFCFVAPPTYVMLLECWMGSCWETQPPSPPRPPLPVPARLHICCRSHSNPHQSLSNASPLCMAGLYFFRRLARNRGSNISRDDPPLILRGEPSSISLQGVQTSPHPLPNGRPVTVCFSFTRDEMRRRLRATRISVPVSHKWLKRLPAEKKEK